MTLHPSEHPVFVTQDGRRRRGASWFGRGLAALAVAWIAAVVVGAFGFATLPIARVRLPVATHALKALGVHVRVASHVHHRRAVIVRVRGQARGARDRT